MKTVIIIPARYASRRYPGKPLVMLRDGNGHSKTLIERSWQAAMAVPNIDAVYIATDDTRIEKVAHDFGASVIMTSTQCENGTIRCAETIETAQLKADIVVNLQGDSPLTPPWFIQELVARMTHNPDMAVATPVLRCDAQTYQHFRNDRQAGRVGGTTAVFAANGQALYFSKEVLPYIDPTHAAQAYHQVFHHVGLYAYRPSALLRYRALKIGPLEQLEGLEQLRFLENNIPIHCIEVDGKGRVFWELNNPEDVDRIEMILAK